jgi:hypothetical protein
VVEQRGAERRRFDDRLGRRASSRLLEDEHDIHHVHAHTAARLGQQHADDAHLGELVPEPRDATGLVRPRFAHVRGGAPALQQLAHRVAERELVVGEGEAHDYFLGRPRTRSAITLRWISFVPA